MIEIWVDFEEGYETHIYIAIDNGKARHYYHWDMLLLWHDVDILNASCIFIKAN